MAANVANVLDSGRLRVAVYAIDAAIALIWFARERSHPEASEREWWPTYWLLTGLLLAVLAVSRATAIGDLVGEFGRDRARAGGWYDHRRNLQAVVVAGVIAVWFSGVVLTIWRIPPRRRRYLPNVVAISTVVAFAAVRLVSLHQVDSLLYGHDVGGIRVVSITELLLLVGVLATTVGVRGFAPATTPALSGHRVEA